ncbi:hypothetical protein MXB_100 [Myxobolus squamalis]|nr:hypothetical protein MXB_100 [Myxobolus squamalis]
MSGISKQLVLHFSKNFINYGFKAKFCQKMCIQLRHSSSSGKVSVMENNLTIASKNFDGEISAVGAFIKSGSRYCTKYPSGITYLVKRMAFTCTRKFTESTAVGDQINYIQGVADCQSSRDLMIYALMFSNKKLEKSIELLGESFLRPLYSPSMIERTKSNILLELEQEKYAPEPEVEFTQLRYHASYNEIDLGIPEIPTAESLSNIKEGTIRSYHNALYKPERTVIAGINVDHDFLIEYVQNYIKFSDTTSMVSSSLPIDDFPAKYTGGVSIKCTKKPRTQPGHTEFPELAHVALGFECFPDSHPSLFAAYVMHGILGSGRSFSSGGPGKGLFSRLNQNVLCRYFWVNSCISDIVAYSDTGMYYVYGSCDPDYVKKFVTVIMDQFLSILKDPISAGELQRAKKQILSLALSGLEHRSAMLEDLGR